MAEKLGLSTKVRELKLGPTFTNDKSTAFHTLKYDFKPASVDVSKMAVVDVGTNNTMTVTVPHSDDAGTPPSVFKGSQRQYHKECVLIIDRITGEITLEKLSSNIQVKKTRSEIKSQSLLGVSNSNTGNRPITPIENTKSPTHGRTTSRTKVVSGKKREPTLQLPAKQLSPLRASPYHGKNSPPIVNNSSPAQQITAMASLPMIGMDVEDFTTSIPQQFPQSSASSRTASPQNIEQKSVHVKPREMDDGNLSDSSSSSSSSDSSDSESDAESIPVPKIANGHCNGKVSSPSLIMPDNLLNDDLQLSESESDSD